MAQLTAKIPCSRQSGSMVFAATGDALGRGVQRLEQRLNHPFYHAYRAFLEEQVQYHGRYHAIIASEYFLESVGGAAALFPRDYTVLPQTKSSQFSRSKVWSASTPAAIQAGKNDSTTARRRLNDSIS